MLTHARSLIGLPMLAVTARAAYEQNALQDDDAAVQTAKTALDWMPAYMALDASLLLVMDDKSWSYRGPVLVHHVAVLGTILLAQHRKRDSKILDRRWLVYNTVEMSAQLLTLQYYAERWNLPGKFWVSAAVYAIYVASRIFGPLLELYRGQKVHQFWNYGGVETNTARIANCVEIGLFMLNVVWSWKGGQRLMRALWTEDRRVDTYDK